MFCQLFFLTPIFPCHQECEEALAEAMSEDPGGMLDAGGMFITGNGHDLYEIRISNFQ